METWISIFSLEKVNRGATSPRGCVLGHVTAGRGLVTFTSLVSRPGGSGLYPGFRARPGSSGVVRGEDWRRLSWQQRPFPTPPPRAHWWSHTARCGNTEPAWAPQEPLGSRDSRELQPWGPRSFADS